MIDRTAAVSATAHATPPTATPAAKPARSFADDFRFAAATTKTATDKTATGKTTDTTTAKAAPRPDGEQTKKVAGHHYARIQNGAEKGLYLNQLDASPREGAAFKMVKRDDRVFHVYGTGKDRVVVELKAKTATDTTGGTDSTSTTDSTDSTNRA